MSVSTKRATIDDIDEITHIHQERFGSFFLTALGKTFLKNYYESFVLNGNIGQLYTVKVDGQLQGFCALVFSSNGSSKQILLANLAKFIRILFVLVFTRPKAVFELVKRFIHGKGPVFEGPEIMSIATVKNTLGLGSILLEKGLSDLKAQNFKWVSLTTDFENNEPTIRFYKKNGFIESDVFYTANNRKMYRFKKEL
jgi:ribosomal protein S18 acetylase RimI-like enzyme